MIRILQSFSLLFVLQYFLCTLEYFMILMTQLCDLVGIRLKITITDRYALVLLEQALVGHGEFH